MGKVLIIKNGNSDKRINDFANTSFLKKEKRYYNSVDGTVNEHALMKLKQDFVDGGLVIMITYQKYRVSKQGNHRKRTKW